MLTFLLQASLQPEKKVAYETKRAEKEAEDALHKDFFSLFYYDDKTKQEHETDHFSKLRVVPNVCILLPSILTAITTLSNDVVSLFIHTFFLNVHNLSECV